ncbi:leucyl aminopeptidase [Desulfovibrio sp. OttesenSCG-928-A18]|nr:leucyl aminopeptidase [Desulfovibrio sp. OttesenSCG-928-A18]
MDIRFQNASGGEWRADCAMVFAFVKDGPEQYAPALWEAAPWLEISPGLRDFGGKKDEQLLLYGHPELPVPRVLLCGLGGREDFSLEHFRETVAKAMCFCRSRGFETLGLPVECLDYAARAADRTREFLLREATVAAMLGLHRCEMYRSALGEQDGDTPADPRWLGYLFTEKETPDAAHRAVRQGEAEASGVILARDLSNAPANHLGPSVLAEEARKLASAHAFNCTVLDAEQIRDMGMGALWAVGQGSEQEPRFIVLEHCPQGKEAHKPVIVVGKGVTFDTGGISLKPPAKMHEMKGDMGGAAAVLGLFAAIGALPDADVLPRVVGLIPAAENMPDGRSVRPGDVVTTLSGKTVEILNTDAEGRLLLCDALSYAQQQWEPAVLLDIATLTGACVIALGDYGTGLFTADPFLRRGIEEAAEDTGDLVWPLPLWDAYDKNLKSDVADMTNMGPREGGALNAALFLRRFVNKGVRWAHLDIAGPGYVVKASPLLPVPGGTGMGVRLLCRLLRDKDALGPLE